MSVFKADFSANHSGSIICETSSPLLLLVWVARTKRLNSKKSLESFLSLPSILGYLGKETKNTDEHIIMNKIFIYARPCVNKDFVHSDGTWIGQARAIWYNDFLFSCSLKNSFSQKKVSHSLVFESNSPWLASLQSK